MKTVNRQAWLLRVVMAAGAASFGAAAMSFSLAQATKAGAPQTAYRLASYDARVGAAWAEYLVAQSDDAAKRHAARLARDAAERDPTAVAAFVTLGLGQQMAGRTAKARSYLRYVERLSRRDFRAELWAIEDAVERGNYRDALRHYDNALKTKSSASDLLFPILNGAIAEPPIRTELLRVLLARPSWSDPFLRQLAVQGPVTPATAALFVGLGRHRAEIATGTVETLVNRLVDAHENRLAWAVYQANTRGVAPDRIRSSSFERVTDAPSVFDWNLANTSDITTSVSGAGRGRALAFQFSPGSTGAAATQRQMLPPGRYTLTVTGHDEAGEAAWVLTCGNGIQLGSLALPSNDAAQTLDFAVDPGCATQMLTLEARTNDEAAGLSGTITSVRIDHIR